MADVDPSNAGRTSVAECLEGNNISAEECLTASCVCICTDESLVSTDISTDECLIETVTLDDVFVESDEQGAEVCADAGDETNGTWSTFAIRSADEGGAGHAEISTEGAGTSDEYPDGMLEGRRSKDECPEELLQESFCTGIDSCPVDTPEVVAVGDKMTGEMPDELASEDKCPKGISGDGTLVVDCTVEGGKFRDVVKSSLHVTTDDCPSSERFESTQERTAGELVVQTTASDITVSPDDPSTS